MGMFSVGAGVSTGWRSAASVSRTRLRIEPAIISVTPQPKLLAKYLRVPTLILGFLLLLLLLLCSEAAGLLSVGTAFRIISANYLQNNLSQHDIDGDELNSSGDGEDPLAPPSNSSHRR